MLQMLLSVVCVGLEADCILCLHNRKLKSSLLSESSSSMANFVFLDSERMGRILCVNNFLYKRKVVPGEKQYFYCVDKCGSSVHILLGEITSLNEKHEHSNHEERIAKLDCLPNFM